MCIRDSDEGDHVVAFKFVNDKGELVDSLTGKYGTISIDKDGNYTYTCLLYTSRCV